MSVQRWTADGYGAQQGEMMPDPEGPWMLAADHARIVAEAGAAVFAFHPEWTVTGMCDPDCLACRRLTELITEREKGYEEGKADAEQAHAAAWDRATFDSTAYEQGKRDAAEEARAASVALGGAVPQRGAAHAAALAATNLRWDAEVARALDVGAEIGRAAAAPAPSPPTTPSLRSGRWCWTRMGPQASGSTPTTA
jgi:hypothetical protein